MAIPSGGWIKLYRCIDENFLWPKNRPFTKLEAWLYILLKANYNDKKVLIDGNPIEVKRGQFITSEVKLSKEWLWDRGTVRRFLSLLQNDEHMIVKNATGKYTALTIVNYDFYQGDTTEDATGETTGDTTGETTQLISKEINKIYLYYTQKINPLPKADEAQMIMDWGNDLPEEEVFKAIDIAANKKKRWFSYVDGIIKNMIRDRKEGAANGQSTGSVSKSDGERKEKPLFDRSKFTFKSEPG
jgi:hypothetical protein